MGDGQYEDFSAAELLDKARERYHVYHLHIKETGAGSRPETVAGWKQLMGDNCIVIDKHQDVSKVVAEQIINNVSPMSSDKQTSDESEDGQSDESEISEEIL